MLRLHICLLIQRLKLYWFKGRLLLLSSSALPVRHLHLRVGPRQHPSGIRQSGLLLHLC